MSLTGASDRSDLRWATSGYDGAVTGTDAPPNLDCASCGAPATAYVPKRGQRFLPSDEPGKLGMVAHPPIGYCKKCGPPVPMRWAGWVALWCEGCAMWGRELRPGRRCGGEALVP